MKRLILISFGFALFFSLTLLMSCTNKKTENASIKSANQEMVVSPLDSCDEAVDTDSLSGQKDTNNIENSNEEPLEEESAK